MANPFSLLHQSRKSERLTAEEEKDIARAIRKAEDTARHAVLGHPAAEGIIKKKPDRAERTRAGAVEAEIDELGRHLVELETGGVLDAYLSRRRAEVLSESRTVYLKDGGTK